MRRRPSRNAGYRRIFALELSFGFGFCAEACILEVLVLLGGNIALRLQQPPFVNCPDGGSAGSQLPTSMRFLAGIFQRVEEIALDATLRRLAIHFTGWGLFTGAVVASGCRDSLAKNADTAKFPARKPVSGTAQRAGLPPNGAMGIWAFTKTGRRGQAPAQT